MRKKHKLYLDSDDVKRGYYVYMHREVPNGDVFYVGRLRNASVGSGTPQFVVV